MLPFTTFRSAVRPFRYFPLNARSCSYKTPPFSCRFQIHKITSASISTMDNVDAQAQEEVYYFGPYKINKCEVFYTTDLSYALVNLRPVVPGHILVCPRRVVKRFRDMTPEETADLWLSAQRIGSKIESHFKASSLTFSIQDGPEAGQTVPHVHIHILPRKGGDFEKNDEVYDVIDEKEARLKEKLDLDKEREDRTSGEMAQEANDLRALF